MGDESVGSELSWLSLHSIEKEILKQKKIE
jgi:hypothetical protein